ncbi:hypothetical protein EVJ58_g6607 [Rhodofomes roseus]|uniref:Uncharacterized protein n=1 Tax=Rhodofomes roseus TaxID=34475 RepID=A0A4Y9Y700_9APHY|nr:hypothetical protein EVJ58_g6607 [Rhodofomes roseus]
MEHPRVQDPSGEVCPDYLGPAYAAIRQRMAANGGMTEAEVAQALKEGWQTEHEQRLEGWQLQVQADFAEAEAERGRQREEADAKLAEERRVREEEKQALEKKKPKLARMVPNMPPQNILQDRISDFAREKLAKLGYIEIDYFTAHSKEEATRHARTVADDAIMLVKGGRRRQLQFRPGGHGQDAEAELNTLPLWPREWRDQYAAFFLAIASHKDSQDPVGQGALMLYVDRVRREWHRRAIAKDVDDTVFDIGVFSKETYDECRTRVGNKRQKEAIDNNTGSIELHMDEFLRTITEEKQKQRMLGPFSQHELEAIIGPFQTSPLSIIPKPHKPGAFRLIQDFSFPRSPSHGYPSINQALHADDFPCTWGTFTAFSLLCYRLPPGSQAAVRDVAEAYRTVPLHPSQWPGTVIRASRGDDYLVDTAAAFGATPNAGVYGGVADAGTDIMRFTGIGPVSKWVDDHTFFRILREHIDAYNAERQEWRKQVAFHSGAHHEGGRLWYGGDVLPDGRVDEFVEDFEFPIRDLSSASPRSREDALFSSCLADIDAISAELGIPWQKEKDVPFATTFVFTGLLWDLDAKTVAIPRAKADKYRTAIATWRTSRTHVLEEVQKLYGKLLHASLVVPDGRSYLTNLESMLGIYHDNPFMPRTPPRGTVEDIEWWDATLTRTDLARPIPGPQPVRRLEAFSDASSGTGIAIVVNGHWRAWVLRDGWKRDGRDIAWAEAVGFELLVYCLTAFPSLPERARLFGDNNVVVNGWRNGRSRNRQVNAVIRRIHKATAGRGREFFLSYIPSADNPADAPSRGRYPPAAYLLPPVPVPDMVRPFLRDAIVEGPHRDEHAASFTRSRRGSGTSVEHRSAGSLADTDDSPADASWFFRAVPNWDD